MSAPIVFIDDEPQICRVYSLTLRRLGREILTFTDPHAALLHMAVSERPSVVVCDYRMPGLTGLEVLARLPEDIPFVLLSGDLPDTRAAAARRGAVAFLAKPIRPDELSAAVSRCLDGGP